MSSAIMSKQLHYEFLLSILLAFKITNFKITNCKNIVIWLSLTNVCITERQIHVLLCEYIYCLFTLFLTSGFWYLMSLEGKESHHQPIL